MLYEGTPDTPHPGRWWELIEKYKVSILYTAPTAIRSFMKLGREIPDKFDLSSLRVLGSVGEPINPEAWIWYRDVIGGGKTPVVDTWWQTETGAIMVTRAARHHGDQARERRRCRCPGISVDVVDDDGAPVGNDEGGLLVDHRAVAVDGCAASGATRTASSRPTGRSSPTFRADRSTSPATAHDATRTATSGCSAGSTTS